MTVTASGSIGMALDGSSPSSTIMLSGTTGNVVGKWKLTAVNEPMSVTKINLLLADWGTSLDQWDSIKNLTIEYPRQDGTTGTRTVSPSTTNATFDNLDMYIPKNGSSVVTAKADFYEIASESADFGDQIKVSFDYDGVFAAVGLASGVAKTTAGTVDTIAATHVLYKTLVTVTKDTSGMSTVLVSGTTNTLYKFTVTADSRGNAGLKRMTFAVSVTDNGTSSNSVYVGQFALLKDSVDISTTNVLLSAVAGLGTVSGQADNTTAAARVSMESGTSVYIGGTGTGNGALGTTTTWLNANLGYTGGATAPETGDLAVPAGATAHFTLNGVAGTGFSGADDDAIAVELQGDTTAPADGSFDVVDNDVTASPEYVLVLALPATGVTDASDVEFIWTDYSAISHTGAVADNSGTPDTSPDSSSDFANGWLVKNFPLGAWSLVA